MRWSMTSSHHYSNGVLARIGPTCRDIIRRHYLEGELGPILREDCSDFKMLRPLLHAIGRGWVACSVVFGQERRFVPALAPVVPAAITDGAKKKCSRVLNSVAGLRRWVHCTRRHSCDGTAPSVCSDCLSLHAQVEDFQAVLKDTDTWAISDALADAPAVPPDWVRERARHIDRERGDAEQHLRSALASPVAFANAAIDDHDEFLTSGSVEVLTAAARAVRQQQPPFALALTISATTIGTRLARNGALRSSVLLTDAWLEKAAALFSADGIATQNNHSMSLNQHLIRPMTARLSMRR